MDKDHLVPKKVKMFPQSTKKLDCPAMVKVSRRILFDDFVASAVPVLLTSPLDIVNIIIYTPKNSACILKRSQWPRGAVIGFINFD